MSDADDGTVISLDSACTAYDANRYAARRFVPDPDDPFTASGTLLLQPNRDDVARDHRDCRSAPNDDNHNDDGNDVQYHVSSAAPDPTTFPRDLVVLLAAPRVSPNANVRPDPDHHDRDELDDFDLDVPASHLDADTKTMIPCFHSIELCSIFYSRGRNLRKNRHFKNKTNFIAHDFCNDLFQGF